MDRLDYWLWLASSMPSTHLAGAAARRLRGGTRRAWHRLRRPGPRDPSFTVHEQAERLRGLRAARGPIEPNERAAARAIVTRLWPGLAAEVCTSADRILSGELWLFGEWRTHERGELAPGIAAIDWTRDPLHGGRHPSSPSTTIDPVTSGTDARAVWEAGRLAHVVWLAEAHLLCGMTGTECARGMQDRGLYARAAIAHVRDFMATQPVGLGIHWTCAMEAALRVIHITRAMLLLRDCEQLDDRVLCDALEAIGEHARFIEGELEDTQVVPGNHLLADLAGLAVVGLCWPELEGASRWRRWALETFGRELVRQGHDDGFGFEASLPYHRFATELGLVVQAFARRQGLSLKADALERLWRMVDVLRGATLPDGWIASVGDNDSSRGWSTGPGAALDARSPIAVAVAIGARGTAPIVPPDALWLGGISGALRCERRRQPPSNKASAFRAGGLVVLTGEGGRTAGTLWAGDHGQQGLGGHAHSDKLSSEVCVAGRRVVVDPGSPTYLADPLERDAYRSTAAHPTVEVDDAEQSEPVPGRPFLLPQTADARIVEMAERRGEAVHDAYLRLRPGVRHRRIVEIPADVEGVIVADVLEGDGVHRMVVHWPLTRAGVRLRAASESERARLSAIESSRHGTGRFDPTRVVELPDEAGPFALLAFASETPFDLELHEAMWSPGYGERRMGTRLDLVLRARLPARVTTAFLSIDGR